MSNPETLPGMSDRELLEGMTPDQIVDQILQKGEQVAAIERFMNIAGDVLENHHNVTVMQILTEREKNGEIKTTGP